MYVHILFLDWHLWHFVKKWTWVSQIRFTVQYLFSAVFVYGILEIVCVFQKFVLHFENSRWVPSYGLDILKAHQKFSMHVRNYIGILEIILLKRFCDRKQNKYWFRFSRLLFFNLWNIFVLVIAAFLAGFRSFWFQFWFSTATQHLHSRMIENREKMKSKTFTK